MAQKCLFDFEKNLQQKTKEEKKKEELDNSKAILNQEETEIKEEFKGPAIVLKNLPASYFVSAGYNGGKKKAVIKLYEPKSEKIYYWLDNTNHKPYCLTNLSINDLKKIPRLKNNQGFDHFERIKKYDALFDREIQVTKIITNDPLAIGGRASGSIRDIIPEDFPKYANRSIEPGDIKIWESKIRYYQSYIYDRKIYPGMIYEVRNGNLTSVSNLESEQTINQIKEKFQDATNEELEHIEKWARLLEYPAPKFKRAAIDIEVLSTVSTRIPNPRQAAYPIICVSAYTSKDQKRVMILKRPGVEYGTENLPENTNIEYFDKEKNLIIAVFKILWEYPFILTYNGDDFDLRYLANRAINLGINREKIPIIVRQRVCLLKYGIHIDLYRFFFNRSIKIYAFKNRYKNVSLNDVGKAILGMEKIPLEKTFAELTYTELGKYCLKDSEITFKLTSFEDELTMKLILVLSRISSMPMEDVSRQGVSRWIRNFMHREHRKRNILIPNYEDILSKKGKTTTISIIKGKKYKGAIVVEPVPGVHFNVAVLDFPSLYPSIIKVWNLGYQSVRCTHPECRNNLVPNTTHWVCTKKRGLESLLIGSLRDIRVRWYKARANDKHLPNDIRNWYSIAQGALKVILNASYGVFGADTFDLYCPPVAEATAAIGRHAITQILNRAKNLNIQVLYGDTDSLFLKNPSKEQISDLTRWTEEKLKMGIDVEKVYRYAVFSSRKKNYLGILKDGTVDVKGLTGKKRHIPLIIKSSFNKMKERLAQVQNPADFEAAKKDISKIVHNCYSIIKKRKWENMNDLAFHVVLGEDLHRYTKTTPQHVKAARILQKQGVEIKAGDIISFIKVIREPRVKPVEVTRKNEVDVDKYIAYLQSTFDQVLDALGLSFDEIIGLTKLERFWS